MLRSLLELQVFFKVEIKLGQTLIFIDEIQNLPNLVHLLRFFYEETPGYHVIAAGSLFGNYLAKEKISMPVGRVEYAYMYPLDFFEFLQAIGKNNLLKVLTEVTSSQGLSPSIHQLALRHFYQYLMIGGMPELVGKFQSNVSPLELERVFNGLFESYLDDVDKDIWEKGDAGKISRRDLYDVWWMLSRGYVAKERIVEERMGVSMKKYWRKLLKLVRELPENYDVLSGLGEVMSRSKKYWTRAKLLSELELELASRV